VFLLMASRLFASAIAVAFCGEGGGESYSQFPVTSSQSGDSATSAAVSCPLVPKPGYVSTATAQSNAILQSGSASVSASQSAAYAMASLQADYTLLVTGGTGVGKFELLATDVYVHDYVDTADYDIEFGGTQLSNHTDGFGGWYAVANLYGTFTSGVPEVLPLTMRVRVAEYGADRRSGNASVNFTGVSIVNEDNGPNLDALASLQLIPEP
jgi:hypothetical protein